MKLRQLFEATETVGIIFGRFNPPHQGHKAAWEEAAKNTHWYVGTNKSTIGPKDPLPFDIKIQAMETIWPEIKGHIIPEQTWWSLAAAVYKKHGEINLKIITDETDAKVFVPGLQKSNGVESKHGYFKFKSIEWQQAPRVSSATELRAAVANDDPKKFAKAAGVPADTKVAGEPFFDLVKYYLGQQTKKESLDEAQTGDVYMRFKVKQPLDKNRGKPTLMAFAGFANTPAELTLDTAKMNFNVLNKKQDIVNAIKKVIGDKLFIGAEKVVIYNDGAVNPKKFPQYGEFLDWVQKFGKEKVKIVDKPESDAEDGEKGPGKKRVKQKWANPKDYKDDKTETTKYFTIDNARLMKFLQKSAPTIMQAYRPAAKQFVMEPAQYKAFRNWMRSPDVVSKFGDTNVKVDKSKSFSQSVGKEFEHMEDVSPDEENEFHVALDKLVHKYFGHSSDEKKKKKSKEVDEIWGFARKSNKRNTYKKKKEEPIEPSVQDRIAARRKAAAKGDKDAWSSKKEIPTDEDLGSLPSPEIIIAIAAAAKMTPLAIKTLWKTAKGAYKIKKFADRAGIKMADKVVK